MKTILIGDFIMRKTFIPKEEIYLPIMDFDARGGKADERA